MKPGEYLLDEDSGPITLNAGRRATRIVVRNQGDRPIQVGSHYHFFEVNRALDFERSVARGMRLDIAAGTAMRFEPGEEKDVALIEFAGRRWLMGHRGLVNGPLENLGL
jgi:urease subunit beta